jgi:hypothetical protein
MPVDERSRHQLYRKLDELMGAQEATTLMELLPPSGWGDVARKQDLEAFRLATRQDLEALRLELHADMDRLARRLVMWTSSMMVALTALAFAAGRFV